MKRLALTFSFPRPVRTVASALSRAELFRSTPENKDGVPPDAHVTHPPLETRGGIDGERDRRRRREREEKDSI